MTIFKKRFKIMIFAVLPAAVSIFALHSCGVEGNNGAKGAKITEPVNVSLLHVEPGNISETYKDSGILESAQEAIVTSSIPGILIKFYIREGDAVRKGETMALIDRADYELELRKAAAIESGKRKNFNRLKNLWKKKAASKAEYDAAETDFELAKTALSRAELNLERTSVKSPISGQVVSRNTVIGNLVSPGMPLFKVVNTGTLKLTVYLSEKEVVHLNQGGGVRLHADAYPGEFFNANIRSVRVSPTPAAASFPVEIEVKSGGKLKPGMVARVSLRGRVFSSILLVPAEAITVRTGFSYIFVYENGRAVLREVSTGRRFGDMTQITGGLKAGDYIVPVYTSALTDGAPVNVINKELLNQMDTIGRVKVK